MSCDALACASSREPRRAGLLVSVRSPEEAELALAGGADIIDVKEPAQGALGRAADRTIGAVLDRVAGRRPVSAALGELGKVLSSQYSVPSTCLDPRLAFVKWGLADCGNDYASPTRQRGMSRREGDAARYSVTAAPQSPSNLPKWQSALLSELGRPTNPQMVLVAYADWQCARAPALHEVVAFACQRPGNVLLIDTHSKGEGRWTSSEGRGARGEGREFLAPRPSSRAARRTLLDWLTAETISVLCGQCHAAGVRVALAGSLGLEEIDQLRGAGPDWFAVRGAVCEGGNRLGRVAVDKVRRLVGHLTKPAIL
jgi:hypothetical protein